MEGRGQRARRSRSASSSTRAPATRTSWRSSSTTSAEIGIEAVEEGIDTETYFTQMADGACTICRAGWFADYPTYDNFMYDLFHSDSLGGNNYGVRERRVRRAGRRGQGRRSIPKSRPSLFHQAETILLDEVGVIPIVWYRGDYVFNEDKIGNFTADQLRPHHLGERVQQAGLAIADPDLAGSGQRGGRGRVSAPGLPPLSSRITMTSYIIRRLLLIIPTVFLALSFLFFLFFALPGDPARLIAGGADRNIDSGVIERINERYGLDDPHPRPVRELLGAHHPVGPRRVVPQPPQRQRDPRREGGQQPPARASGRSSSRSSSASPSGCCPRMRRYSLSDRFTTIVTAAASAIPVFVLGFVLQWLFAVQPNKRGWPEWAQLRTQGLGPDTWTFFFIPTGEQWRYLILPAITLASRLHRPGRPHDPRLDARGDAGRLHAHGAGQGPDRARGGRQARPAQRHAARSSPSSASTSARSSARPSSPRPCSRGRGSGRRSPTRSPSATCR